MNGKHVAEMIEQMIDLKLARQQHNVQGGRQDVAQDEEKFARLRKELGGALDELAACS